MASPGRTTRSPRSSAGDLREKAPAADAPLPSSSTPVNTSGSHNGRSAASPRQRPSSPRASSPPVVSPRGSRNSHLEAVRAIENCRSVFEHELLRLMEEKNRLERAILASQDRMNRELDQLKKVPTGMSREIVDPKPSGARLHRNPDLI